MAFIPGKFVLLGTGGCRWNGNSFEGSNGATYSGVSDAQHAAKICFNAVAGISSLVGFEYYFEGKDCSELTICQGFQKSLY